MSRLFKRISSTPTGAVILNLLLAYIIFMVCRIAFILNNWQQYDGHITASVLGQWLRGSLRFDTSALCYLCSLYIVLTLLPLHFKEKNGYYRVARWIFIIFVMLGAVMNLVDCVYYPFSGNRTTIGVFTEFKGDSNVGAIVLKEALHSWYITVLGILILVALIAFTCTPEARNVAHRCRYYLLRVPIFLLAVTLSVIGIRGGWGSSHPISMNNASQYVSRPAEAVAILNTPFCFIRTVNKKQIHNPHYVADDELEQIYSPVFTPDSISDVRKRNVVVFILESFGSEYIGAMNPGSQDYKSYTPFLDSLINESLTFSSSYSNGRKSIDGMPSILSSIPMLGANLFLSEYAMNDISGIAGELKNLGYHSAFFHGAENSSMGFQSFARTTGYDEYYGMTEFCEDSNYAGKALYDGLWAIWDEEFLQFFCDRMSGFSEPFVSTVFTASSHHPFKVPERYEGAFPKGEVPIHQCIGYTDNALRLFFEKASREPWFDNTLFVLTADHTNQSANPDYQNDYGLYRVPVIFYDPSGELRGRRNAIAQQADIMPTVLHYIGYDRPFVAFGQNLLSTPDSCTYAINYNNGIYQYFSGDYMLQFDGRETTALYNIATDPDLHYNIKDSEIGTVSEFELRVKAILQQYMARMVENRLTVGNQSR